MEYEILLSVYFLVIWVNQSWRNWKVHFNPPSGGQGAARASPGV